MIHLPKFQPERWGLSWGGWLDNRHGEWWLLAQLALIAAHLLPPWPAPGAWGYAWPLPLALAGAILLLHDGHAQRTAAGQPVLMDVLPPLLALIQQQRLQAVTLSAALPHRHPAA